MFECTQCGKRYFAGEGQICNRVLPNSMVCKGSICHESLFPRVAKQRVKHWVVSVTYPSTEPGRRY